LNVVLAGGLLMRSLWGPVEAADLVIEGERVGEQAAGAPSFDASGCVIVPGHVCSHHHLYSALARAMPAPERSPRNFVEVLEMIWWRLDRALDAEAIRLSAELGSLEAALAGTTTIIDHHASPEAMEGSLDLVADALEAAGTRGAVCYEVSDRHGEDRGLAGVEENIRFAAANRRPLVRAMMGAHASFTIGPATLGALVDAARDVRAPIHIHVAEDAVDEEDSLDRYGQRVIHRLEAAGALAEGDLVAHGVCLDATEIGTLHDSGAWLAHNARSNMNNAVGYAPVQDAGDRVALGTDGIDGDMFAELRAAHLRAREVNPEAGGDDALRWLAGGSTFAARLFEEPLLGTLVPGAPADLTVLEYSAPTPFREANVAGHYLFGLGRWAVRDVMVAGRWLVRDRHHVVVDTEELASRCRAAAARLWTKMDEL
jgi:putative selenium metabolism protein SsnA